MMRVFRPLVGLLTRSPALPPAFISTFAMALLAGLGLLLAQSPAPKHDVSDFEKRLAKINGQISELRGKIEAEALKESSILSSLARINLNKALVER